MEQPKITVVDGDMMSIIRARQVLSQAGYAVSYVSGPNAIIAKLQYEVPEILLIDLTMAGLNFPHLLAQIEADEQLCDTVIVLYSDMETHHLEQLCEDYDLHGYFGKAMNLQQLPAYLDNFYE